MRETTLNIFKCGFITEGVLAHTSYVKPVWKDPPPPCKEHLVWKDHFPIFIKFYLPFYSMPSEPV